MKGLLLALVALSVTFVCANDKFAEGSASRESQKVYGHVTAAFTPINAKGALDFTNLEKMAARLEEWGIQNVMLGGTTGESVSFSMAERLEVVDHWLAIADKYNLRIFQHVGSDNVVEAREMAQ